MPNPAPVAPELYWLAVMALVMIVTWVPYILNRLAVRGLWMTLDNPKPDAPRHAEWAERLRLAHTNSVENLVVFAPLAVAVVVAGVNDATTALAAMVFVLVRIAYTIIYAIGIPVLRTLAFAVGVVCMLVLALRLLGAL